jgi:hypothetical protein
MTTLTREVCSACDVDLCELCGGHCACPHVRPTSVLLAPLETDLAA